MTEVYYIEPSPLWHFWHGKITRMSHVDLFAPLFFFLMDFFKLHSQMNPHLCTGADSNIMSLIKHLSQKWRTNDGQCVDRDIKNVAFSVKTACTLFIGCDGPSCLAAPLDCGEAVSSVVPLLMSTVCVRSGSAADWQTVPLQPGANQPVSNTCCY